jgi:uncharacterized protein DUF6152
MTRRILVTVVSFAWLIAVGSLQAHHSVAGAYALGKEAKIEGAFNSFRLVNPHSSLKLDVKNQDGSSTEWTFTGGSVNVLARYGIGKTGPNALSPGDTITVTFVPAFDGKSPVGLLRAITYPDGHTIEMRRNDDEQ